MGLINYVDRKKIGQRARSTGEAASQVTNHGVSLRREEKTLLGKATCENEVKQKSQRKGSKGVREERSTGSYLLKSGRPEFGDTSKRLQWPGHAYGRVMAEERP